MEYLVRLAQLHESFRKPELEALARHENITIDIIDYESFSPFCIIRLNIPTTSTQTAEDVARSFISRSVLSRGIYELWGQGVTYDDLHHDTRKRTLALREKYKNVTFKFSIDSYCGKRSSSQQRDIINTFRYLAFEGKISMKNPEVEFVVFEEWEHSSRPDLDDNEAKAARQPRRLFFGRYIGGTRRDLIEKHDLKKRPYISTTSMDAELALATANMALAAPGKIFLDPFVGTGGFMVAASELGALTFGSDIDGRSYRGKGAGLAKGVGANFARYGLQELFGDCFTSDLTNTPLRCQGLPGAKVSRWLNGIISDPPYGVREGLKVLGTRQTKLSTPSTINGNQLPDPNGLTHEQPHYIDGVLAHLLPGYIAPKKPYSFSRMLDDILEFAARSLVDGGRLAFWMPSANEADQELALPKHPCLELKHVCVQSFNKWSRRLLIYERLKGDIVDDSEGVLNGRLKVVGSSADELNPFRRLYFNGFQPS